MPPDSLSPPDFVAFVPVMDNYGGIERNLIALSSFWHARGKVFEILCFRCRADLQAFADHPLRITTLTESENPWVRARLLAAHLKRRYRESGNASLLFGIKGAFYMGISSRSPFVLHFTDPPSLIPGLTRPGLLGAIRRFGAAWFDARGVRLSQRMITMTRRNAAELKAVYGRDSEVVFQGGNPPSPGFQRDAIGEELRVLSVCRIEPSKRIDWILDAVHCFNHGGNSRPAVAVIVGRGSAREELIEHAKKIGMGATAIFPGEIGPRELEKEFARASLFAMPAIQGFGLPALEALYRQVPVVLHEDSGVFEALEGERLAVISRGDAAKFADDLGRTLDGVSAGTWPETPSTELPTESGWAEKIARLCGWMPKEKDSHG